MSLATKPKPAAASAKGFPADEVESALREVLLEAAEIEAEKLDKELPLSPRMAAATPLELDSLVVVEILCEVEPIIDFALPEKVVQSGGYASVDEAVAHLMPGIEREWDKRKGTKK